MSPSRFTLAQSKIRLWDPLSSPIGETEALTQKVCALHPLGFQALDLLLTFYDLGGKVELRENPRISANLQTPPEDGRSQWPDQEPEAATIPALATRGRYQLRNRFCAAGQMGTCLEW